MTSPRTLKDAPGLRQIWVMWIALAGVLLAGAHLLAVQSIHFDYAVPLRDKAAWQVAAGLSCAGLIYALLRPLLSWTEAAGLSGHRALLALMVVTGAGMRLLMWNSLPILEDDWYRYLWDGAVTAHGYNPYAVSPDDAQGEAYAATLQPLAHQSGVVIERINHSNLRTIYPPGAQAFFALAYMIKPWGLDAWRLVCLMGDTATFALVLGLLRVLNIPLLAGVIYWWNPIAAKELMNSAHMESILLPFVAGAMLLAIREYRMTASAVLALAAGIKLWPVILLPLVLRPLAAHRVRLSVALMLVALILVVVTAPMMLAGVGETSGLWAYATRWQTNNAVLPLVNAAVFDFGAPLGLSKEAAALAARGVFGMILVGVIATAVRTRATDAHDEITRAAIIVTALLLLSPAQFPWYLTWVLPFACVVRWRGIFAASVLLPVYYASFDYLARGDYATYRDGLVWLVWLPIYVAFIMDWRQARHAGKARHA